MLDKIKKDRLETLQKVREMKEFKTMTSITEECSPEKTQEDDGHLQVKKQSPLGFHKSFVIKQF